MNYYMADPHFGHDRVIDFAGRPFRDVHHMDETIISNVIKRVGPDDDLWILGDFGFGATSRKDGYLEMIFGRLPGRKHLIEGNHDGDRVRSMGWDSIHDLANIQDQGTKVTLCHYPMITWLDARKGAVMLFGHVHERWKGSRNCINVGVDQWGFSPVTLKEAMKRGSKMTVNPLWPLVEHGNKAPGE